MKKNFFVLISVLFLFFSFNGYAQKTEEISLFEIDRLIKDTEYDKALQLLNSYLKKHPENFDNVQVRIKKIMNARKQYSALAEQLLWIIENEPENSQKIYEITEQLEQFEKNPSNQIKNFIQDAKKSSEFNYFRSLFLTIQKESASFTERKLYNLAILKIKEGFWLYKDEFYAKWNNNPQIIEQMESLINQLEMQTIVFEDKTLVNQINEQTQIIDEFISQKKYNEINKELENITKSIQILAGIRNNLLNIIEKMSELYEKNYDSDLNDASYIPFMIRFISGVDNIPHSGILGCVEYYWDLTVKNLNDKVFTQLQNNYYDFTDSLNNENKEKMQENLESIQKFVAIQRKILDFYNLFEQDSDYKKENPLEYYYVLGDTLLVLSQKTLSVNELYFKLLGIQQEQSILIEKILNDTENTDDKKIKSLFDLSSQAAKIVGNKNDYELQNYQWYNKYKKQKKDIWNSLLQAYNFLVDKTFNEAKNIQLDLFNQIFYAYKSNIETNSFDIEKRFEVAQELLDGLPVQLSKEEIQQMKENSQIIVDFDYSKKHKTEENLGILYCYPNFAQTLIMEAQSKIKNTQSKINNYCDAVYSNLKENSLISSENNSSNSQEFYIDYMDNQQKYFCEYEKKCNNLLGMAKQQRNKSILARNEGELRFSEAQVSLEKNDFDMARKKLQDSLKKFDESLKYQDDYELRLECDSKLYELGIKIAKLENEIVVKEVRELKNKAKDAYFNGRFEDAQKYLNQAKSRWSVTNEIPDEEIVMLSNFVNSAISMKTGRDIPVSAPQYPEMSQLLNLAYAYFEEGSELIKKGKRNEGITKLDIAVENVQKLQLVYPLNQEAAILTLRINQLKDSKKFEREFSQKINAAKLMCENPKTRKEGYANLLDYYEIQPDYKGLKELIYKVEIDIGIRQKKADNSGVKKANQLLSEAKKIYSSAKDDEEKLKQALAKVDESLSLVMDNEEAVKLKDEITTKIGGTVITVLSTEDERLYQLAVQRLQSNNVIEANLILEKILQKKGNASLQKIKDLKNKIDARS
ncbi:MAG: hypothetical protein SPH83_05285 [Treponema sp.]|nr:hypothetical protein [Spirochaetales bacterium]MDY6189893.1 hypothetical protein [Treponema sp.]